MTDRPILFSGQMVRALLEGRKTQTRRLLKLPKWAAVPPQYEEDVDGGISTICEETGCFARLPRVAAPGDRLWVKEGHAIVPSSAYRMSDGVQQTINPADPYYAAIYREGWERSKPRWRPSIHMPRWASRLTLTVTDVRVQRLQEISEGDAVREGVTLIEGAVECPLKAYALLWNSLHDKPGERWADNPEIVALTFIVEKRNIDA